MPTEKTGIWAVSPDEYHADVSANSRSMMEVLSESSRKYQAMFVTGTLPRAIPTSAMRLGSMKHIAVLQPQCWDTFVEIIPAEVLAKNGAKSTNEYKAWAADPAQGQDTCQERRIGHRSPHDRLAAR